MTNRKSFQHLPADDNPQFLQDGIEIYKKMIEKYPEKNVENLDNILNGICAALTCLMTANVDKRDHRNFTQLIYKILNDNI
jgi:hypothetical protein